MEIKFSADSKATKEVKRQIFERIALDYKQHPFYETIDLFHPDLHIPVADLWSSVNHAKKLELTEYFKAHVNKHIIDADDASTLIINEYLQSVELEPNKEGILFEEQRNNCIQQLKENQPFRYLYIDNWPFEPVEHKSFLFKIENSLFIECFNLNQPFKVGLIELQTIYELYFSIEKLNSIQELASVEYSDKSNETNIGKTQLAINAATENEAKTVVNQILMPLGGLDPQHRQKIMKSDDFDRLVRYTEHLVLYDSLPENIEIIEQIGISAEHIRFTFYLLHKRLFTTKSIRPIFYEFLQRAFRQLETHEKETIRKKFSIPPSSYFTDFNISS